MLKRLFDGGVVHMVWRKDLFVGCDFAGICGWGFDACLIEIDCGVSWWVVCVLDLLCGC